VTQSAKNSTPAAFRNIGDYWEHQGLHPLPTPLEPHPADLAAINRLDAVARATVRISTPRPEDIPVQFNPATEATLRLAVLGQSGALDRLSVEEIARYLTLAMWPGRRFRKALWGWWLLAYLDLHDAIEVTVGTPRTAPARPGHDRERIAEVTLAA
jgi:hypothetical protein